MTTTHKRLGVGLATSLFGVLVACAMLFSVTAQAAPQKLVGTVGPGYTISLKTAAGKRVTGLTRGTYTLTVRDRSNKHNFFVGGPGTSKSITAVGFVGTKTVTIRFGSGKYTFLCTPHSSVMRGGISVR